MIDPIQYTTDDRELNAAAFLPFVREIWPGDYDPERTQAALSRTINITARCRTVGAHLVRP